MDILIYIYICKIYIISLNYVNYVLLYSNILLFLHIVIELCIVILILYKIILD